MIDSSLLPEVDGLSIAALARLFAKTTNSYKFLFFLSLLDILKRRHFNTAEQITFRELVIEMLANVWYPHLFFKLSFGTQDKLAQKLDSLNLQVDDSTLKSIDKEKKTLREVISKQPIDDTVIFISRYVPFRLLTVFFQGELAGVDSRHEVDQRIPALAFELFNTQRPLYRFDEEWGITYLAISAHKLYGPKGVGALVVRRGHHLEPQIYGGGHQHGLRSGTLNVPGIAGLGEACRLRQLEMESDERSIAKKRDRLQQLLLDSIPGLVVNGDLDHRLAGNLHISIPGIPNSAVIARIRHKLAISTGAACSSGVETPSHVLRAMKLPEDHIEGALRIGLGKFTTDDEVEEAAQILGETVRQIQEVMSVS